MSTYAGHAVMVPLKAEHKISAGHQPISKHLSNLKSDHAKCYAVGLTLPNNRLREFFGWGLGMHTRATSTWSRIARSTLRGYVISCSGAFIASAA